MVLESTFNRIKEEIDIVKIISDYIKLEKKSSSYIGLCPFHPDQNPSLHVSPTKKIYKCFSCGAAGDAITFIQNYEKVSYPRAMQIAGEKIGINMEFANDENMQNLTKYHNLLKESASFYHFILINTQEGLAAKNYLYKRNLNDDIIKRFNIGLAQDAPDLLYQNLLKEKYQPLDMIEAGVVKGTSTYTDVFKNRIVFPLDDINGKIVGFSGRIYQEANKEESKYLNSFENKVFKKGNLLYNFASAQNNIRNKDEIYIFEGFLDVIAAYKCNIHNAVATMGTSISQNHLNTIKKTTNNIVICYDGDLPGITASKKAIMQLLKAEFNVMAILLPTKMDPDDYLNKYGASEFENLLVNKQISGYDYLYETSKLDLNMNNLNSIEIFKNATFDMMNYFNSSVLNERLIEKLARDLNVSVESLKFDFNKKPIVEQIQSELPDISLPVLPPKVKHNKGKFIKASKRLIYIAYYSKDQCHYIKNKLNDHFVDKLHNSLLVQIISFYNKNEKMDESFKDSLGKNELNLLNDILTSEIDFIDINENLINECVQQIYAYYNDKEYIDIRDKLQTDINNDVTINREKLIEITEKRKKTIRKIIK